MSGQRGDEKPGHLPSRTHQARGGCQRVRTPPRRPARRADLAGITWRPDPSRYESTGAVPR
eukprot:8978590-Pyramimonas_sp.AAC.2